MEGLWLQLSSFLIGLRISLTLFSMLFDHFACYNLTYFIAIVIVSTWQDITLFDIHIEI